MHFSSSFVAPFHFRSSCFTMSCSTGDRLNSPSVLCKTQHSVSGKTKTDQRNSHGLPLTTLPVWKTGLHAVSDSRHAEIQNTLTNDSHPSESSTWSHTDVTWTAEIIFLPGSFWQWWISCRPPPVWTLSAGPSSGSPSSWRTESPSEFAGSAPRWTGTCSAPTKGD